MTLSTEQEAHLYTIDAESAAATKMIRQYMGVTYEQAVQLMEEYAGMPFARAGIDGDHVIASNEGMEQERLL